jgi:hypothetical protein
MKVVKVAGNGIYQQGEEEYPYICPRPLGRPSTTSGEEKIE